MSSLTRALTQWNKHHYFTMEYTASGVPPLLIIVYWQGVR
ncbi:Unknown protein sequence [Pseudomonas syringae pv. syringae]|nr:Unknown protein sequence [Pseudomonas syringae pv. syringae]